MQNRAPGVTWPRIWDCEGGGEVGDRNDTASNIRIFIIYFSPWILTNANQQSTGEKNQLAMEEIRGYFFYADASVFDVRSEYTWFFNASLPDFFRALSVGLITRALSVSGVHCSCIACCPTMQCLGSASQILDPILSQSPTVKTKGPQYQARVFSSLYTINAFVCIISNLETKNEIKVVFFLAQNSFF